MRGGWVTLACAGLCALAGAAGAAERLSLRLEEADRHAREREIVRRTVVLRNDGATTQTVRLKWRTAVEAARIEAGARSLAPPPHGEERTVLALRMPPARRAVRLRLEVEAAGPGGERARLADALRVYPERPELPWAFLSNRRIGAYDPGGGLIQPLRGLGGRPEALPSPTAAGDFDGDLLVIGEEAMRNEEEWRGLHEALMSRTESGRRPAVVVLYQSYGARDGKRGTWESIRPTAAGKDLLRELAEEDLAGWREEGWVTQGPLIDASAEGHTKRFRVLAVAGERGNMEGGARSAEKKAVLVEEALPGGRVLLRCQAPLLSRWAREPACELLLNALMRYGLEAKGKHAEEVKEQHGKHGKNGKDLKAGSGMSAD